MPTRVPSCGHTELALLHDDGGRYTAGGGSGTGCQAQHRLHGGRRSTRTATKKVEAIDAKMCGTANRWSMEARTALIAISKTLACLERPWCTVEDVPHFLALKSRAGVPGERARSNTFFFVW